jgi:transcriptional regulator with XRE-family HTH domain
MRPEMSFGARLRYHRERAGKTRAVLGGLVGRSEEWVKAVETDRLLHPRLPMLLRLADVLGITDLAQLTGNQSIPVASIRKGTHDAAGAVATAMITATRTPAAEQPSLATLTVRVDQAWTLWHRSDAHRSAVAKDNLAVVHFLGNALREATDTVRYDTFACTTVLELAEHGDAVRADARQLAATIGLAS